MGGVPERTDEVQTGVGNSQLLVSNYLEMIIEYLNVFLILTYVNI